MKYYGNPRHARDQPTVFASHPASDSLVCLGLHLYSYNEPGLFLYLYLYLYLQVTPHRNGWLVWDYTCTMSNVFVFNSVFVFVTRSSIQMITAYDKVFL